MKHLLSLFFIGMLLLSCNKENEITECGVANPLEDLAWLADLKDPCEEDEICSTSISQAIYNGETVFYAFLAGPLCDPAFRVVLFDCEGDTVKIYQEEDLELFTEEIESDSIIYSCW